MQVILNRDIKNIGKKGEVKNVPDGYARNLLIPQGAVRAVDARGAVKASAQRERELQKKDANEQALIEKLKSIATTPLVLQGKANEQGHLFVGIHEKNVLGALERLGIAKGASISIPAPIKEIGEHTITVRVGKWSGELNILVKNI